MRRVLVPLLAAALVVLVVVGVVLATGREPTRSVADRDPSACETSADTPGPLLDLGLQPGTGDPADPLLDVAEVERLADLAAAAGADVLSTGVSWDSVLPTAASRPLFDALDLVVAAADERGLALRIKLTGSPAWAVAGGGGASTWAPPTTRDELARWREFVALTLRHLDGRVDYVEVWGEPDEPAYWGGAPDPVAFARLLRATEPVVRRLAPRATVVTGGLGGNDLGYLERLYEALGDARPFDLVGVHPYAGALPPTVQPASARYDGPFGPYDASFLGYRDLHDVMAAHGDSRRGLYFGEFGYSTEAREGIIGTPDEVRATYVDQALGSATCTPYVVALSWYYLHPTAWDEPAWTLLDEQGEPNRTYDALAAWAGTRP